MNIEHAPLAIAVFVWAASILFLVAPLVRKSRP